jgi:Ser/Thr protein kinase RdoA (MazF antagonist)
MVEALSDEWDLGEWRSWSRALKGKANITLVVETSRGRFALRCSNFRKTQASLDFELALLEHLRSTGYPAPRVVPTRKGEPYTIGADGSYCLVTEWITGAHFDADNPAHLAEAGGALGRFHRTVTGFVAEVAPEPKMDLAQATVQGPLAFDAVRRMAAEIAGPETVAALAPACETLTAAYAEWSARVPPDLARTVIHGSYGGSALLYDGDRLAAVLDFDRVAWNWRTLDLAYSAKSFAREAGSDLPAPTGHRSGGAMLDPSRCRTYVGAYLAEQPLPAAELEALPAVMAAQRLIKVASKAANLVRKHERFGQEGRDVDKLCGVMVKELRFLDWLRERGAELLPTA